MSDRFMPIDTALDGRWILPVAPPPPPKTTVLGVACGDLTSRPAWCAVAADARLLTPGDPMFGEQPIWETHYTVLAAEYLDIGTPYPAVAARINRLAKRLYDRDSKGDYHALVDASSLGRPVVAAIRDSIISACHVTGVTVTTGDGGDGALLWSSEATIGLTYLVSRLQAILQGGRLHAPASPTIDDLFRSLLDYDLATDRGPDLVRALSLATVAEYAPVRYDVDMDTLPTPSL